jgi:hypothetical protein
MTNFLGFVQLASICILLKQLGSNYFILGVN